MHLDLSKKLMECTLGEYIAAERTIGIISGWVIAFFTVILAAIGRFFYKRWKKKQPEAPVQPSIETERKHYQHRNGGEHICKKFSIDADFICTLNTKHDGKHEAHDEAGQIVSSWE